MAITRMQREVIDEIDKIQGEMIALSDRLHQNPELSFEEFQAVAWLAANPGLLGRIKEDFSQMPGR